jgi:TonB family protein
LAAAGVFVFSSCNSTGPDRGPGTTAATSSGAAIPDLPVAGASFQRDRERIRSALEMDHPAEAARLLEVHASAGEADAEFALGFLHDIGAGADWDSGAALKLLRAAAAQQHVGAVRYLTWKYKSGFGVDADPSEADRIALLVSATAAVETVVPSTWLNFTAQGCEPNLRRAVLWIQTAASSGDKVALGNLADVYLKSPVLPANLEAHLFWLGKAADAGNPRSAYQYSRYLQAGAGTDAERTRALGYLTAAAEGGWVSAEIELGKKLRDGSKGVAADPSRARAWFEKAAAAGDPDGQFQLAYLLEDQGAPADAAVALSLFEKSAAGGNVSALEQLAYAYRTGKIVAMDLPRSVEYYRAAAVKGSTWAKLELGRLYLRGLNGSPDYPEAVHWFHAAANAGSEKAMYELGVLYETGQGVEQSDEVAFEWMEKAAREGYGPAQSKVAYYLSEGKGVPRDEEEAVTWLRLAIGKGEPWAHSQLGFFYERGIALPKDRLRACQEYSECLKKLYNGWTGAALMMSLASTPPELQAGAREVIEKNLSSEVAESDTPLDNVLVRTLAMPNRWLSDRPRAVARLTEHVRLQHFWAVRTWVDLELHQQPAGLARAEEILAPFATNMAPDIRLARAELMLLRGASEAEEAEAVATCRELAGTGFADARFFCALADVFGVGGASPSEARAEFKAALDGQSLIAWSYVFSAGTVERLLASWTSVKSESPPDDETIARKVAALPATEVRQPQSVWMAKPVYPMRQRMLGADGSATVQFVVAADGRVKAPFVVNSTHRDFEAPALKAVSAWRFAPALKDGKPVECRMAVPLIFTLENDPAAIQLKSP